MIYKFCVFLEKFVKLSLFIKYCSEGQIEMSFTPTLNLLEKHVIGGPSLTVTFKSIMTFC